MDFEEFKKKMNFYLEELSIKFNEEQYKKFYTYMNLLLEWNEKINLTAITDKEEIILKHFIDSLTIAKYIDKNSKLIDVGTGAGFPGIPIKIYREDVEITLLDSLNKRVNFLDTVIKELKLEKIVAIHGRAEEIARNKEYRERFDVATSRAVANLATLSEYLVPFVKEDGIIISMKGDNIEEEQEEAKRAIKVLGAKLKKVERFELPKSNIKRSLVILKKVSKTPKKYPRKPGTPAKEPIK